MGDAQGVVLKLETVHFVGNAVRKQQGIHQLTHLLQEIKQRHANRRVAFVCYDNIDYDSGDDAVPVVVALGNGHGSMDCRLLIQEAAKQCGYVPLDIHLVNEAGASVWSVTEQAATEFPQEQPAAIAAISIGRRLQNPLFELVKVPPASLGLGMYQHDLSNKELEEKLDVTCVDAVATVGVDLNTCSKEILQKVPGLTAASLAQR